MKRMERRLLAVLLTVTALLFGIAAAAADGDFSYYQETDAQTGRQTITIYQYNGNAKKVTVPDTIEGLPVACVYGFAGKTALEEVILPGTVHTLEYGAFSGCTGLKSIDLPMNLEVIGYAAFSDCTALTEISFPASVKEISYGAFSGCSGLKKMVFMPGTVRVPEYAAYELTSLETVVFPDSLESIGEWAFAATSLREAQFPASLKSVGSYAFRGCKSLQAIRFAGTAPDGLALDDWAFSDCALREVSLPDGTTSIGSGCFAENEGLAVLDVPDSVEELDAYQGAIILVVGRDSKALISLLRQDAFGYVLRESRVPAVTEGSTVDARAKAIVRAVVRPGMTDWEKALALHDYLTLHANYDYTFKYYYADGVLLHGTGVCNSYTLAYQKLLDEVGIANTTETGDDHIWNMVRLDGEWYHIDCTWDDPGEGGSENHTYFCVSNYALTDVDNHECFQKKQTSKSYQANFAYRMGGLDPRIEEVSRLIAEKGAGAGESFVLWPESFRFGWDMGIHDRTAILALQDREIIAGDTAYTVAIRYDAKTNEEPNAAKANHNGRFAAPPPVPDLQARSEEHPKLTVTILSKKAIRNMPELVVAVGDELTLPVPEGAADAVWSSDGAAVRTDGNRISVKAAGTARVMASVPQADGSDLLYVYPVTAEELLTLHMPDGLTELRENAFFGSPAQHIVIGRGVKRIGKNAFSGMTNLTEICFLGENTEIDPQSFGAAQNMRFVCPAGSKAAEYADRAGIARYPGD